MKIIRQLNEMFLEFNLDKIQTQIHEQQAIFILYKQHHS